MKRAEGNRMVQSKAQQYRVEHSKIKPSNKTAQNRIELSE